MQQYQSLELIKRIKSLSETGLVYYQNEYDKERYEELFALSMELLSIVSGQSLTTLTDFLPPSKDYPTPKVDIRALILNQANELLLVKEKLDGKWALAGGWGDIGFTPSEVIAKEIQEETGLNATVSRLLAIYDKKCHPHPPQAFYVYKLVFLCEVTGGEINPSFDIEDVAYFPINHLPELSTDRILASQINQLHAIALEGSQVHID